MTNKQIARILRETGALIELTGGNTFRARAYQNASRIVDRLDEPAVDLVSRKELTQVSGIGDGMGAQIEELLTRGSFDVLDELLAEIPAGLIDILRIKGIGAKKARTLWQNLNVTTVDELEEAATIGRLAGLPGFGAKTQETVLENVRLFKHNRNRRRYADAVALAEPFLNTLANVEGVDVVSLTGDLRRKMETVDRAAYVVATTDPSVTAGRLAQNVPAATVVSNDDGAFVEAQFPDGLPLSIHVVTGDRFGSVLWRTTGSAEHCAAFEERFGTPSALPTEEDLFTEAGAPFILPELRENQGEVTAAAEGALPDLVQLEDLQGILHNHSTYSDGTHTLRQMAEAVREKGYSYFGICDHSQSLTIANGMTVDRVQRQQEEIRQLNQEFASGSDAPFRVFSGIECDVLADGSLDFSDEVLASFDFVVASIHSRFNMTEREATDRLIRAVENPYTTMLGHATGRLLLVRAGYPIDHQAVIEACAATGTAIEINANPRRLDMDWRWLRYATDKGVLISINPDAHSIEELSYLRWGVAAARKGWLTKEQCLNAMHLDEFAGWLDARLRTARRFPT